MKNLFFPIFILSIFCIAFGNASAQKSVIKGTVIDSLKNTPLAFVTVSLLDKKNNRLVKNTISKDNGSFELNELQSRLYILQIVSVGYQPKTIILKNFPVATEPTIDLGTIPVSIAVAGMGDVVITATVKKPIVKQEVDRISYDVQADPENSGNSVLDMLRKVPMISVDATDKIMLKGSSNYKILINGQPSALIAQDPSDIFKAMPASNILRIEVITTPPAKYDAEGLAGIINIITKKKIGDGYNGNISASYNSIYGPRFNLNGTFKQGKFGASGYIGFQIPNKQNLDNGYTNNITSPVKTFLTQYGTNESRNHNPYGSVELSYELDSLNLITTNINSYEWISSRNTTQQSGLTDSNNTLLQSYFMSNSASNTYHGTDLAINYQHGYKNNKERMLTASYKYNSQGNTSNSSGLYTEQYNELLPNYQQFNNSGTKEHTFQLDYVHPIKKLTFEAGAKAILRDNYSNYYYNNYDSLSGLYITDTTQTNNFRYQQNVYSVYNSYELKLSRFVLKAGARLEHTTVNANFTSVNDSIKQSYNNLIPSISFQWKFNSSNSISFGFTERIQRPGIWQLNPFINKSDPQVISYGNPGLQPVLNHSFEMNYSRFSKGNITLGLFYSFANNTVENVMSVNADTVTQTTYQNVGQNKRLGLNLNTNYPITKKWNVNVNSQLLYVWLKGTVNGELYNQSGFQGYCFVGTGYNFPKDYHAGIDFGYDSRYVLLQGKDNEYFNFSFGVTKDILKKKGSISFYVLDPFQQYRKIDDYTNTATFNQYNYNYQYARRVNITFRYKFGHLSSEIKKSEKVISNDDLNEGRGH